MRVHFHYHGHNCSLFVYGFCNNFSLFLDKEPVGDQIKLHRNIIDILSDRTTLSYFVQFLESKNGQPLVKFWLDVEAFKAVQNNSTAYLESRNSIYDNVRLKLKQSESIDEGESCRHDDCMSLCTTSRSESNIDESEELQSNAGDEVDLSRITGPSYDFERMTQSLTDDEKSKICEKKRRKDEVEGDGSRQEQTSDTKSTTSEVKAREIQPTILEDALRIYRKYLVTDSVYSIELPATILSKLSLALCETESGADSDVDSNHLWEAFEDAQKYVLEVMEKEYLSTFLDSSFYCKYTVDVLTSESLNLREILYCESALFYFMEFLEQEKDSCKLPYLEFWLSATNFRKQSDQNSKLDPSQMKSDALVLYEKWFSLQATAPLNFSNRVRTIVEEQICSLDPSITQCFDLPIKIVEVFLDRCCFKKFVKSQLFFKHLSEIMSKIDGSEKVNSANGVIRRNSTLSVTFPKKSHRRTNSDSIDKKGISRSISAQNTLLAGLDHKRNKNKTDMSIDSRQLADPDLLWRRQSSVNGLSFGRVDAFGRYERDFELPTGSNSILSSKSSFQLQNGLIDVDDPHSLLELNSTQSRFKNVMRKLVHLPEDSVQQEIAWQVAEMIVKDVTSITLNGNSS